VVGDYLKDPGGTLLAILHHLHEWAITHESIIVPVLPIAVGALVGMRCWWARLCHVQFLAHARLVTVLLPPSVDPVGGQALWSNLVGLLRPAWRRWLAGQPVGAELAIQGDDLGHRWAVVVGHDRRS